MDKHDHHTSIMAEKHINATGKSKVHDTGGYRNTGNGFNGIQAGGRKSRSKPAVLTRRDGGRAESSGGQASPQLAVPKKRLPMVTAFMEKNSSPFSQGNAVENHPALPGQST
jgi:hypothetical protein